MGVGVFIHRAQRGKGQEGIALGVKYIDEAVNNVIDSRHFQFFLFPYGLIDLHELIGFAVGNSCQIQSTELCCTLIFVAYLHLSKVDIFAAFNLSLSIWCFAENVNQVEDLFGINIRFYL